MNSQEMKLYYSVASIWNYLLGQELSRKPYETLGNVCFGCKKTSRDFMNLDLCYGKRNFEFSLGSLLSGRYAKLKVDVICNNLVNQP